MNPKEEQKQHAPNINPSNLNSNMPTYPHIHNQSQYPNHQHRNMHYNQYDNVRSGQNQGYPYNYNKQQNRGLSYGNYSHNNQNYQYNHYQNYQYPPNNPNEWQQYPQNMHSQEYYYGYYPQSQPNQLNYQSQYGNQSLYLNTTIKTKENEQKSKLKGEQYKQAQIDPRKQIKNNQLQNKAKPKNQAEFQKAIKRQKQKKKEYSDQCDSQNSQQSEEEDEEQLYQKTKIITKKKDPILDTPQQIKKWIQARKRNYPSANRIKNDSDKIAGEMSILQSKIRKKIMLVTADGRGLIKKLKNMHILKRLINDSRTEVPRKRNKQVKEKEEKIKKIKLHRVEETTFKISKKEEEAQINQKQKIESEKILDKIESSSSNEQAIQMPIKKQVLPEIQEQIPEKPAQNQQIQPQNIGKNPKISGLTPEDMIKHLKQKQQEDKQFYDQLLSYRTNSLNYKYSSQTLQTNFLLEDIFEESSYLLQIIRHIVKSNFYSSQ